MSGALMKKILAAGLVLPAFSALLRAPALASEWAHLPYEPPVIITEPDCPSSFMMDTHHRHNPEELGSMTRDGYPVMLGAAGESQYVMPRGMELTAPVLVRGTPQPD